MALKQLRVGEHVRITVRARDREQATGIEFRAGERYTFAATGIWKDAWEKCSAAGWERTLYKPVSGLRRKPAFPWLALVGYLRGHFDQAFLISTYREHTCAYGGELLCFANDADALYRNNSGLVELSVTRTA